MKKVLPKILICINITVIVLLLLFSGVFLYFTSSPSVFGHSAILYENQTKNHKISLLIIENKPKEILIGDRVTFYTLENDNKIQHIKLVSDIDNKTLLFKDFNENVDLNSDLFIGKIVNDNVFWGGFISSLIKSKHTKLVYVLLIGGFFIISLSIVLISFILKKKNVISNIIKKDKDDDIVNDNIVLEDIDENNNLCEEETEELKDENTEIMTKENANEPHNGLRIVYRDEIIQNVDETTAKKESLTKNPLYEPLLENFDSKPLNIGTSKKQESKLTTKKDDEVDLSKLYDLVEQTDEIEINYIEEENDVFEKIEEKNESKDNFITKDKDETFDLEENASNISIDNLLNDIISKVESEFNSNL